MGFDGTLLAAASIRSCVRFLVLGLILLTPIPAMSQPVDKPAYALFDSAGRPVRWVQLVRDAIRSDVVFFGELHDAPLAHWLTHELVHDVFKRKLRLAIGLEMFEVDQQPVLDSVLAEQLPLPDLPNHTRTWPNYPTDYQPLLQFAVDHQVPVIATNVPREYARLVARQGPQALATLPDPAPARMAPLPLQVDHTLPGYALMSSMLMQHGTQGADSTQLAERARHFAAAQALKDATMAWRIHQTWVPGRTLVHVNGSYHSDRHRRGGPPDEGILHYLRRLRPEARMLTLTTVRQEELRKLEPAYLGKADYILVVPEHFPRSR